MLLAPPIWDVGFSLYEFIHLNATAVNEASHSDESNEDKPTQASFFLQSISADQSCMSRKMYNTQKKKKKTNPQSNFSIHTFNCEAFP